jgi:hypothetical protein
MTILTKALAEHEAAIEDAHEWIGNAERHLRRKKLETARNYLKYAIDELDDAIKAQGVIKEVTHA